MSENNILEEAKIGLELGSKAKFTRILNGVNSNVFLVTDGQKKYILKFYRVDQNTPTRLEHEVTALNLFQENGITNVPELIRHSEELNCSLISFIPGEPVMTFKDEYIPQFQVFFKHLLHLSSTQASVLKLDAIDCCMSLDKIKSQINDRLRKLKVENNALINPLLSTIECLVQDISAALDHSSEFDQLKPILSTVDFGINNTILKNESLYFIDFEFFGWDNPVHFISDTISHPANNLSVIQQEAFLDAILDCYNQEDREPVKVAFKTTNLLFDIKWCLIMLNPFLSTYTSNNSQNERETRQQLQKNKVLAKVELIKQKMQHAKFSN
jgi:tRNA A-37 threonylcarbamoyl transferase component Bud32